MSSVPRIRTQGILQYCGKMDADQRIQQYLLLAKGQRGRALAELINRTTSEQGLFAFGELVDLPNVAELKNSELNQFFSLLLLFAYGTWNDYKAHASGLPPISDQQRLKLKQLTVITMANKHKVIVYDDLMQQLEIPTVRELEDFIITECFYSNIIKGKLDQKHRCLHVHHSIGRDVKQEEVKDLSHRLANWIATSTDLMGTIEGRIQQAYKASEAAKKQREDVEAKQEEIKKTIKVSDSLHLGSDSMALEDSISGAAFDIMDEDRISGRPKRRR